MISRRFPWQVTITGQWQSSVYADVYAVVLTHFGQLVYHNLAVVVFDLSFFTNLAMLSGAHSFTTTAGGGVAVPAYTLIGVAFA